MENSKPSSAPKTTWKTVLVLQLAILFFSLSGVLVKLAGQNPFFSVPFFLLYFSALFILFIYALIWQQILKRVPLTTAYGNRAVSVIWSIVWGALFFKESISWNMILGALIIMAGLYLVVTADG